MNIVVTRRTKASALKHGLSLMVHGMMEFGVLHFYSVLSFVEMGELGFRRRLQLYLYICAPTYSS